MLNIPEEKLPNEFKDEARLDSLFSPFRSKTINPRDWNSKISSWRQLIALYCTNNAVYSFSLSSLNNVFVRNGRPPTCLSAVLEELVKNGDLQSIENFLEKSPKSWSDWAANLLVKKPLVWSFNTIKRSLFSNNINPESVYVHIKIVKEESQQLFASVPNKHRNKIINFDEFLQILNKDVSDSENVKLLLYQLVQEQKAAVTNWEGGKGNALVKIAADNKVIPISEIDVGVYELKQNEKLFTKQVEELEDEIDACVKIVKSHLMKGHRQLAKTCLMKKHAIEKRLLRKINALHNVQTLLGRIQDVHIDADVWNSYKHALSTFNTTFKETGLTEDSVEDTMLQLGEMLDIQQDVENAMARPLTDEDSDLEKELAELMQVEDESDDNNIDDGGIEEELSKLDISRLPDLSIPEVPTEPVVLK